LGRRKKKGFFDENACLDLGNILQDYGMNGDRGRTLRMLNIQSINYRKKKLPEADLFLKMKRELMRRRLI
jgi:hypothetical protein